MPDLPDLDTRIENLKSTIISTENDLALLRHQLKDLEEKKNESEILAGDPLRSERKPCKWPLNPEEYRRYGRQMIVPQIGLQGQLSIKNASVLIIGLGGLGCPAAAYLSGAGVGKLGLMDGDTVEVSNLHRQILHQVGTVGLNKAESAIRNLQNLNPQVSYASIPENLTPHNAKSIFSEYDLILDCTDRPSSRYLISDCAVKLGKPLISASALQTEGQLMVLNYPALPPGQINGGPCYRCIFPKPPPPETVVSCADGGIFGPVVGLVGVLQALEAIKILTCNKPQAPTLFLFSAYDSPQFRTIRLRKRSPKCLACGSAKLLSNNENYQQFCGIAYQAQLPRSKRINVDDYGAIQNKAGKDHILLDVREEVPFSIASLKGSINIPFSTFESGEALKEDSTLRLLPPDKPIFLVCKLGNDSQTALEMMVKAGLDNDGKRSIKDINGGFRAWRNIIDTEWPDF